MAGASARLERHCRASRPGPRCCACCCTCLLGPAGGSRPPAPCLAAVAAASGQKRRAMGWTRWRKWWCLAAAALAPPWACRWRGRRRLGRQVCVHSVFDGASCVVWRCWARALHAWSRAAQGSGRACSEGVLPASAPQAGCARCRRCCCCRRCQAALLRATPRHGPPVGMPAAAARYDAACQAARSLCKLRPWAPPPPPQVTMLLRDPYLCKDINEQHCNTRYLKVHAVPPSCPAARPFCVGFARRAAWHVVPCTNIPQD